MCRLLEEMREEAAAEAAAEATHEKAVETAIRMLEDCLPVEKIALYSGLSVAEVRELEGKRQ